MAIVVFVDGTSPHPYTAESFISDHCQLGATEWCTILLANRLAESHEVYILQKWRRHDECEQGVHYRSILDAPKLNPEVVITLRQPEELPCILELWPLARHLLWLHDLHGPQLSRHSDAILNANAVVLCVSRYHRDRIRRLLQAPTIDVRCIYLPVEDEIQPDNTTWDPTQLVFASSPCKGLSGVLELFDAVREEIPDVELTVFNPGYIPSDVIRRPHVHMRGRRPQKEVFALLRRALCLFHVETQKPETFGRLFAESHALGTPVLAHPFGAAQELLGSDELVDCRDRGQVVARLKAWRRGRRPCVRLSHDLRLPAVYAQWEELLELKNSA